MGGVGGHTWAVDAEPLVEVPPLVVNPQGRGLRAIGLVVCVETDMVHLLRFALSWIIYRLIDSLW